MDSTVIDPVAELTEQLHQLIDGFERRMRESPVPLGSKALAYAVQSGLPPQMAYTVAETARYTGIDERALRREHEAGHLAFVMPKGQTKGYRILTEEVDRWLAESR
ncbi:helix-turn-helix domain-containing protein [Collinsella vaginalis]|uniref:helix-turn-helix domain-containing protein n=1 Tax=Collinsella vaginalis TaxID=1870987 RepID=UPI000A26D4CD|nr:helix-turn-helix domain-containing protein [Collinsella vaginalis]